MGNENWETEIGKRNLGKESLETESGKRDMREDLSVYMPREKLSEDLLVNLLVSTLKAIKALRIPPPKRKSKKNNKTTKMF